MQGACSDKYGPELNDLQTETEKKISLLTDPMPREEEIKKDLIGKTIPYWRFAYLSEFKQFHIDSISSGDNSREYWIGMVLQDGRTGISQSDKILMTYLKQNGTWYLNDVRALWMRYTTHAPLNDWLPVTPLANCTYGIDTHGLRAWVRDGLYGEQQMVGPDVTTPITINSNEVYIMSREDQPIDIDFIYYPKQ